MNKKPLLREQLAAQLREQIARLQTTEPVRIAPERELAEQFGVSRISLRAAVKLLVEEGLLTQIQGKGTYTTPRKAVRALHLFCSPDIKSTDPFYNEFLVEITTTAALQAIALMMVHESQIMAQEPHVPLVVIGVVSESLMARLTEAYSTVIVIQGNGQPTSAIHLGFDDYAIGRRAAALLLEAGYRRIALLAGPDRYPSASQRKLGFLDGLAEQDMQADTWTSKMNWSGGYDAAEALEAWIAADPAPAALFAANDWMAVGLIQRLKERAVPVPDALAVIGCDNIQLASQFTPALSTFDLDMKLLTAELMRLLGGVAAKLSAYPDTVASEPADVPPSERPGISPTGRDGMQSLLLPATLILRDSFVHRVVKTH